MFFTVPNSVADPDPNPDPDQPDPRVFGHPGSRSGSTCQRYGSGSGSQAWAPLKKSNIHEPQVVEL
jgi:hypothetical protein